MASYSSKLAHLNTWRETPRMSALGHKQTVRCKRHVRFTPDSGHERCTADVRSSNSGHQPHITPMKTERPPRSGLSENSIALTSISSAALLMLHQDLGAERHARVKIGDIVVDQPEAT